MASITSIGRHSPNNTGSPSSSSGVSVLLPPASGGLGGNISDGEYARKRRVYMSLLKDLRASGADTEFDPPKIVVIGKQSAGKSSLIEVVTGINTPRDSGICTRCPMEYSMSSTATTATTWSCTISLRSEGSSEPRGPSAVSPRPQQFGDPITDKTQVELWLRRAQGAILSTNPDKTQWFTKSADEIKQAIENRTGMREFTEDTIVIDIQDPNGTNLSFVDLPGIIANENGDLNLVRLTKDLVRKHAVGHHTLILVAISANDNVQNHDAMVLAKEADPSGKNTIVVITKPDSISDGDTMTELQHIWRQTFDRRNLPYYFHHSYYCVRLPNDQEREQGWTKATLSNFFDVTKPWSDFTDRGKLGVTNFVRDINEVLVGIMEWYLPIIRGVIEIALRNCTDRLDKLSPVASHDDEKADIEIEREREELTSRITRIENTRDRMDGLGTV